MDGVIYEGHVLHFVYFPFITYKQWVQKYVMHSDNTVAYADNNNSYAR